MAALCPVSYFTGCSFPGTFLIYGPLFCAGPGYLAVQAVSLLAKCALTDPGILPRAAPAEGENCIYGKIFWWVFVRTP